jgi:hypothetical protein
MDKHLKTLAPRHVDTKFIKVDAEVSEPFDESFIRGNGFSTILC